MFLPVTATELPYIAAVNRWANNSPEYEVAAKAEFASAADSFLIGHAMSENHIVVTHEQISVRLKARWVIHTVGPVWHGGSRGEPELLAFCYRESLARADEAGAATVAFPAISTGVYGYPVEAAAATAVSTVRSTPTNVAEVRLVAFNQKTFDAYRQILE